MTIGVYVRHINKEKHGTPAALAAKAAKYGVDTVLIQGPWQAPKKGSDIVVTRNANLKTFRPYADALRKKGIDARVWGYPWVGHEDEFVASIIKMGASSAGVCIDAELGYANDTRTKKFSGRTKLACAQGALKLVTLVAQLQDLPLREEEPLTFTSYGNSKGHRNFPWLEFSEAARELSPQWYTGIYKNWGENLGYEDWTSSKFIPSVPLYGRKSGANLHEFLSQVYGTQQSDGRWPPIHCCDGFFFWSWRQGSEDEWRIVRRWSGWLAQGLCFTDQ